MSTIAAIAYLSLMFIPVVSLAYIASKVNWRRDLSDLITLWKKSNFFRKILTFASIFICLTAHAQSHHYRNVMTVHFKGAVVISQLTKLDTGTIDIGLKLISIDITRGNRQVYSIVKTEPFDLADEGFKARRLWLGTPDKTGTGIKVVEAVELVNPKGETADFIIKKSKTVYIAYNILE